MRIALFSFALLISLVAQAYITPITSGGGGTVTSVGMTVPSFLSVSGSPVTGSGTLAVTLSGLALPVVNGGTGQTSYTNGQLLIGNSTGNTLAKGTLTAGTGISVANGAGSITLSNTGVTSAAVTVPSFLSVSGSPITTTGTFAISLSGTALPVANGGTGQTSYTDGQILIGNSTGNTLAKSTLTAGTGMSIANGSGSITLNNTGVTSASLTVPAFLSVSGSPITTSGTFAVSLSGTALPVANGGTGQTTYTDGQLLIGNSVGNTLSKATLTAGTGMSISNGNGSVTLNNTGVTNIAMTVPGILSVSGSPVTTTGTLALSLANQSANTVFSGPASGSATTPTFRALVNSDQPGPTILSKSGAYTITSTDIANNTVIYADTSGGAFTITLPSPTGLSGKVIRVFDKAGTFGTNNLTLARSGSESIQGVAANLVLSAAWGSYGFQTDGTNWYKISSNSNRATKVFTSSGSWTPPGGVTYAMFFARGGAGGGGAGAGGGGGSTTTAAGGGGGGGAGGSAFSAVGNYTVTPGSAITVTVGAGGTAGTGGTGGVQNAAGSTGTGGSSGGNGGNSSVLIGSTTYTFVGGISGGHGVGGSIAGGGTAGAGGVGSGPFAARNGGAGGAANAAGTSSGGGATGTRGGPYTITGTGGAGGNAGGANGGGGGGSGGSPAGADYNSGVAASTGSLAGGDGGAAGATGGAATSTGSVVAAQGEGGIGGSGGGGGGVLASTGTAGGNGSNGIAGSDGLVTISWVE